MKIIDNKKDFYDYLVSYYGLDDYVVFDRRNSIPLLNYEQYGLFSTIPATLEHDGENIYIITLVAGENVGQAMFIRTVNWGRNKAKASILKYDESLLTKWDINFNIVGCCAEETKKLITPDYPLILSAYRTGGWHYNVAKALDIFKNPILKGTPFTSILSPNAIWEGIYNYLLKSKEPVITDSRTDIEHLESAGFDKKTSFRNIK